MLKALFACIALFLAQVSGAATSPSTASRRDVFDWENQKFPEGCGNPFLDVHQFMEFYNASISALVAKRGVGAKGVSELFAVSEMSNEIATLFPNYTEESPIDRLVITQLCAFQKIRNKEVFEIKVGEIAKWDLKTSGFEKLGPQQLSFERAENDEWKTTKNLQAKISKHEVGNFFKNLNGLTAVGFASENPADRKAKLGFWQPKATLTLSFSDTKRSPEVWMLAAAYDPSTKKNKHYLARADKETTFEVSETSIDNFKVDLFHFRNKTIHSLKKDQITHFSVQDGLQSVEFAKQGDGNWTAKGKILKGEVQGKAKKEFIERALTQLMDLRPTEYLDGRTPYALGLQRPLRIVEFRGSKDGKDSTLGSLFFGRKLGEDKVVLRTEGMDAAASVVFNVDEILTFNSDAFLDSPPPPAVDEAEKAKQASANLKKGVKMQLEPTVKTPKEVTKLPAPIVKPGHKYTAEIVLDNAKKIVITFAPDKAPYTVSNFLNLARNKYYDGVKFHRVLPGFMAQTGDPTGTGAGGPGYKFDNEDNDLPHKPGAISMAHAGPGTNGSQFFLVFTREQTAHLDHKHTVFGQITEGMDVLTAVKQGDVMKTVRVFEEAL